VLIAGLFILAAKEMSEIAKRSVSENDSRVFQQLAIEMEGAVWKSAWDGAWFLRAYDDSGDPIGSSQCQEGQIFIEPQGICAMAGLGLENGQAQQALDSVAKRLLTDHGIILLNPAFTHYYLNLGEITSYPPGYKENAGVFCHTNPWIMIAETRLGRGDRAFDYYRRINPSAREAISEIHRCEPYVYAQMIAGRDAPTHGEAKNSWLTGTASWNYVAITQWILGIRPTYDGLQIQPVIPSGWNDFDVARVFRGVRYDIHAKRIGPGNNVRLTVDGDEIADTVVPIPAGDTGVVRVVARIGEPGN
jgi:cellobiose phosphorylase